MEPFLGEIRAVSFGFAPSGWALCDGSLVPIRFNPALFSVLGTTYGGDGTTTFGLPDLRGRAIVQPGQGAGLSAYKLGQAAGTETVTLEVATMPPHTHGMGTLWVHAGPGSTSIPSGTVLADSGEYQYGDTPGSGTMAAGMVTGTAMPAEGDEPHTNLMPYTVLNYIIALEGTYPPRS